MAGIIKSILDISDIKEIKPNFKEIKIMSREECEKTQTIIFDREKNTLKILTTNNFPEELQKITKSLEQKWFKTDIDYTSTEGFKQAMTRYDEYEEKLKNEEEKEREQKTASWQWAIAILQKVYEQRDTMEPWKFIMEIIRLAFQTWASDLHFQSQESWILCRLRIDWVLQTVLEFTHGDFAKYMQKIKFISWVKMNIDYIPQDGRFTFEATNKDGENKKVDARVNFMPGINSESVVLRFLDPNKWISTFEKLWFVWRTYDTLRKSLEKHTGITILTWPTWSWKTTTLYTILSYLNDWKEKIITLEDPVEYQIEWIQQSQINYNKWYDYAEWLKAILRHDPDIILVWETRDFETANISMNAALTWHKVYTTLHTNSAIESINRLVNMGIKPYILAQSLNLLVAQRLVRQLCPHCASKKEWDFSEKWEISEAIKRIKDANPTMEINFDWYIPVAVGCEKCNGTWYKWRLAIIETLEITDDIKKAINEWNSELEIYSKARWFGFLTLKEDGIIKMLEWKTTLDELRRIL